MDISIKKQRSFRRLRRNYYKKITDIEKYKLDINLKNKLLKLKINIK